MTIMVDPTMPVHKTLLFVVLLKACECLQCYTYCFNSPNQSGMVFVLHCHSVCACACVCVCVCEQHKALHTHAIEIDPITFCKATSCTCIFIWKMYLKGDKIFYRSLL